MWNKIRLLVGYFVIHIYTAIKNLMNCIKRVPAYFIKKVNRCVFLVVVLFSALPLTASLAEISFKEYDIKAGYLLHLGKFIYWPSNSYRDKLSPFAICILGKAPFSEIMIEAMNRKFVKDRRLSVTYLKNTDERVEECQILFITRSKKQYSHDT